MGKGRSPMQNQPLQIRPGCMCHLTKANTKGHLKSASKSSLELLWMLQGKRLSPTKLVALFQSK
eukprot:9973438-Karenia_brevis.AAC.1